VGALPAAHGTYCQPRRRARPMLPTYAHHALRAASIMQSNSVNHVPRLRQSHTSNLGTLTGSKSSRIDCGHGRRAPADRLAARPQR
jgi:hypothetical protein